VKKVKVVIEVWRGTVSEVYAPRGAAVDVTVIDHDCYEEDTGEKPDEAVKRETRGLVAVPH
jgi:hypothetical protein